MASAPPPPDLLYTVGFLAAGIGEFFIGVRLLGAGIKALCGHRLRHILLGLTKTDATSSVLGLIAGAITQSTSVAAFILASMVSSGMLTTRRAMPAVLWSNVGAGALVFVASVDLHLLTAYLMGLVGFLYYLGADQSAKARAWLTLLLGISLLFLGLIETREYSMTLQDFDWFVTGLGFAHEFPMVLFLAATALSYLARSSATTSIVAITFAATGLLTGADTVVMIVGANLGTGLVALEMVRQLHGPPRRLMAFQVMVKVVTTIICGPFLVVDGWMFDWAGIDRLLGLSPFGLATTLAVAYLVVQLLGSVLFSLRMDASHRWLERLIPESPEESLAKPAYIYPQAAADPPTAMDLIVKEQIRVLGRMPKFLDSLRAHPESEPIKPQTLHEATDALLGEIRHLLADLRIMGRLGDNGERMDLLSQSTDNLAGLEESIFKLTEAAQGGLDPKSGNGHLTLLIQDIAEGLHAFLEMAAEALAGDDVTDYQLVQRMTRDRGDLMERLRKEMLVHDANWSPVHEQVMFDLTSHFTRLVWMMHRYAHFREHWAARNGGAA